MKPLLAATIKNVEDIQFPVYGSAKLDGVRCLIKDGKPVSRSLKPIPNRYVQQVLSNHPVLEGMDGELIVGDATHPRCFNITQSAVMSKEGQPNFTFHVFDLHDEPDMPFQMRFLNLCCDLLGLNNSLPILSVHQTELYTVREVLNYEADVLVQGFEGVMIRNPAAMYKYGRSTLKQGILLKLKQFVDGEAVVVGFDELMHNANLATIDELGHTERSSHKAGQVPMDTLGALVVKDVKTGIQFKVGTGFTQEERLTIWNQRDTLMGKLLKYKSFAVGVKEKPRFPTWLGWRSKEDMS